MTLLPREFTAEVAARAISSRIEGHVQLHLDTTKQQQDDNND
jgi:hypothetical protein